MPQKHKISFILNADHTGLSVDPKTLEAELRQAREEFDLDYIQFCMWDMGSLNVEHARKVTIPLLDKYGLKVSEFWCGFGVPAIWGGAGAQYLGLVPPAFRHQRMQDYFRGMEYALELGVNTMCTEFGHYPDDPNDEKYVGLVVALQQIAIELEKNDLYLLEETAAVPAPQIRRLLNDVGSDRFGVNLDPANITSSGKGEPLYFIDMLGPLIKSMHVKDATHAVYPNFGGEAVRFGTGSVKFPEIFKKLKALNYDGFFTLEDQRHMIHPGIVKRNAVDADTWAAQMKESVALLSNMLDEAGF